MCYKFSILILVGVSSHMQVEGLMGPLSCPESWIFSAGSNPLFGALHVVRSIFGQSEDIWVEGEGMLHALHFTRGCNGTVDEWSVSYTNRYVQSDTFTVERARQRPCFFSVTKGNPLATLAASILNMVRRIMSLFFGAMV